jgi:hypothetical protein
VAKPDALEQAAREQAIVSARTRATGMAKASGATLGQLLRISEGGALPPSLPPTGGGAGGAQAGGEPPISPGEYVVNAYVQVTFELK